MSKAYQEKVRHLKGFRFVGDPVKCETLYFTVVSRKTSETELEYKVSYCSPKDTFIKKEGIAVARSSTKTYTISIREGDTFKDINFAIMVDMVKNREDAPKAHRAYLETILDGIGSGL